MQVIGVAEVINKMGEEDVFSKQDETVGVGCYGSPNVHTL